MELCIFIGKIQYAMHNARSSNITNTSHGMASMGDDANKWESSSIGYGCGSINTCILTGKATEKRECSISLERTMGDLGSSETAQLLVRFGKRVPHRNFIEFIKEIDFYEESWIFFSIIKIFSNRKCIVRE